MSDEISLEARMAVAAGFAYAAGKSGKAWADAVDEGVRVAAAAMNGKYARIAQSVLDSSVFKGEYRGYRLEESSQRLIVEIFTDNHGPRQKRDDGVEEIRTDRIDTYTGKQMQKRLDALPVGAVILAFKFMEQMSGSTDEVRIMKHFEILALTGTAPSSAPEAPRQAPTRQAEAPKPAAESPSSAAGGDDDPFNKVSVMSLIAALPGPKAARLAKLARAEGITNIMAAEHADRVKALLDTLD